MKVLLFSILSVLNWTLTLGALLWDRRRLTNAQRARSWNVATWGCAVYWGGIFAALPWVWVTRSEWPEWRRRGLGHALKRSAWVLVEGLGAVAMLVEVFEAIGEGLATALGVDL